MRRGLGKRRSFRVRGSAGNGGGGLSCRCHRLELERLDGHPLAAITTTTVIIIVAISTAVITTAAVTVAVAVAASAAFAAAASGLWLAFLVVLLFLRSGGGRSSARVAVGGESELLAGSLDKARDGRTVLLDLLLCQPVDVEQVVVARRSVLRQLGGGSR